MLVSTSNSHSLALSGNEYFNYVTKVSKEVFSVLEKKSSKEVKVTELKTIFDKELDFKYNGRACIARFWRQMTEHERERYLDLYKEFVLRVWIPKLATYNKEEYKVSNRVEKINDKDSMVRILITTSDNKEVVLDFRVRKYQDSGEMKVVNAVVEGIDMIVSYSGQFAEQVEKGGINSLFDFLQHGNDKNMKKITS